MRNMALYKKAKYIILLFLLLAFLSSDLYSQQWGGKRKPGFWDDWSANLNFGQTSFYGDISIYDDNIGKKLTKESGPAISIIGTKHIDNRFGVSGQILYGKLKGETTRASFEATITEYNLQGSVNMVNLFFPYNNSKMFFSGYAGVGQFLFNSEYQLFDESEENVIEDTGVPEFVYFFGFGASYEVNDRMLITGDMAIRQAQNDAIDTQRTNNNFDYYTYINIGLTYKIRRLFNFSGYSSKGRRGRFPMRRR